jgi:regulator of replication initiation timing
MAKFLRLVLLSFNLILINNIFAANNNHDLDDDLDDLELPESHSTKTNAPVVTPNLPTTVPSPATASGASAGGTKAPNDYAPAARTIAPPSKILFDSAKSNTPDLLPEILDAQNSKSSSKSQTLNLQTAKQVLVVDTQVATTPVVTVDPATQKPVIIEQKLVSKKLATSPATDPVAESDFVPEVNTNQEGGNWVQKRIWWEQAEAAFAQLTADNNQILQIQADYFKQRIIVEKQLNTILCDLNVSRADLVSFIDKLLEFTSTVPNVATVAADKSSATVSQSGHDKSVSDHKNSSGNQRLKKLAILQQVGLENIKTYLTNLKLIDDALDQVLVELNKQIELCQDYEKQAWDDFKEIGRILNDKKAKALFYQVDGYQKNVQKILDYVTGPLKKFFDDQVTKTKKNCEDLAQELKQLAAGGLDLRIELDILAGRTPEPIDQAAEKLAAAKKAKANQSWFSSASDSVTGFFSGIWSWVSGLFK